MAADRNANERSLAAELAETRARLEELQETVDAIRHGEVDALVVAGPEGDQVFTLKGADRPYRILIERMSEGAATIADDGTILFCNGRLARMLETPLEQVIGSSVYAWVDPAERALLESLIRQRNAEGKRNEFTLLTAKGTHVTAYMSAAEVADVDESVTCVVVTDLTERRRAEERIRSLARFPSENPSPVMRVTREGGIIYVNEPALVLLQRWNPHSRGTLPPDLQRHAAEVLSSNRQMKIEIAVGDRVIVFLLAPVAESDYVNIYGTDITERKQAEEALRHERDLFGRLSEASPSAILLFDRNGRVTYANPRAERILDITAREIAARPHDLPMWTMTDYDGRALPYDTLPYPYVMHTRQALLDFRGGFRRVDGRLVFLLINGAPVLGTEGEVTEVVFTIDDITEQATLEQSLRRRTQELALLYNAARDLSGTLDMDRIARSTFRFIMAWMDCDDLVISTVDAEGEIACAAEWRDGQWVDSGDLDRGRSEDDHRAQRSVIKSGAPLVISDYRAHVQGKDSAAKGNGIAGIASSDAYVRRSAIAMPLITGDAVVGTLELFSYRIAAYTQDDLTLLETFAPLAAAAVANATLYRAARDELAGAEKQRANPS